MADRPNILFLMTDHTNSQVISPESQCIKPNLDALASQGVRFNRCYTTNAVCSPARASLMTGLYPSTHGMWDVTQGQRPEWLDVPASRFTYFSMQLAKAGYRNGYFGKWHVEQSSRLDDFGWHEYDIEQALGMERSARFGKSQDSKSEIGYEESSAVHVVTEGYPDFLLSGVGKDTDDLSHPVFNKGIDFIRRHIDSDQSGQPFCCFISVMEPHNPYIPPRRFFEMYDLDDVRVSPTLRDEPIGKPDIVKRMRSVLSKVTDHDWRRVSASYWAVISYIDSEIGRIIEFLKETGQYDNTIIVFTSDHGDMMGSHGLVTKGFGTPYEEVYNIPLIIRTPGTESGREDMNTVTSLVDIGPTLLDLCGAESMDGAQGRSLRHILEGTIGTDVWLDAYAEFYGQRFVYTQRIVWHGNWKYIFSPGGIDELYNLADDPHERINLADDPTHHVHLLDMTKRMWRKMKDIGDYSLLHTQGPTLRVAPIGPGVIEK